MTTIQKMFIEIREKGIKKTVEHILLFCWKNATKVTIACITKYRRGNLKNSIIIESHNDFDCNGGAFYRYLIDHEYNYKYKIVWLIKHPLKEKLPYNVLAFDIFKFSLKKCYYIATSKFLLADDIITPKAREDQISIYCTHGGVTFKNVKGLIVLPEEIDYILSPSERYDPLMCENYSIKHPNGKMLHIGFPSNDVFFNIEKCDYKNSGELYDFNILWMPTFRKNMSGRVDSLGEYPFGIPLFKEISQLLRLNEMMKKKKSRLIIKLHPMQDLTEINRWPELSNIVVLDSKRTKELRIDVYELMLLSDAMISDYSSAVYSYIMLDRPIAFVLSDFQQYKLGFSVQDMNQFLCGNQIYSIDEFFNFIVGVVEGRDYYADKRRKLVKWIYDYLDGDASKRLVEFMKL